MVCGWWGKQKKEMRWKRCGTWMVGKTKERNEMDEVWYVDSGENKRKKKEMWRCATWMVGEKRKEKRKKKCGGVLRGWWGIKGKKKEKRNWEGWGKVRKEKMETEKTKLVLFVCSLCLMQNVKL